MRAQRYVRWMARKLQSESKTGAVLDSVADIIFVVCCAARLLPVVEIPVWLWIWAGVIVFVKIVNQVSALVVSKRFSLPIPGLRGAASKSSMAGVWYAKLVNNLLPNCLSGLAPAQESDALKATGYYTDHGLFITVS